MIRILGLDLDGTLLNDQKEICKENKEILQKVNRKQTQIVLCSGRSPDGMQRELEALNLKEEGQYGIALNGGVIFETGTGRIIKKYNMQREAARALIDLGRSLKDIVNIQLYTGDRVYVERWNETTDFYQKATGSHPQLVEDLGRYIDETIKIVFFRHGEIDYSLNKINALKKQVEPSVPAGTQCVISAPYLVEFFDRKTDKGSGMRQLAQYLGVEPEQILCIGDQENDLPMLRYAGIGAAMANGAAEVKQEADYITHLDNNEGGVAEAVERFILERG